MKATQLLHALGQSLRPDSITRDPLPKARRSQIALAIRRPQWPLADRNTPALW